MTLRPTVFRSLFLQCLFNTLTRLLDVCSKTHTRETSVKVSLRVVSKKIRDHAHPAIFHYYSVSFQLPFLNIFGSLARKGADMTSSRNRVLYVYTCTDVPWLQLSVCMLAHHRNAQKLQFVTFRSSGSALRRLELAGGNQCRFAEQEDRIIHRQHYKDQSLQACLRKQVNIQ